MATKFEISLREALSRETNVERQDIIRLRLAAHSAAAGNIQGAASAIATARLDQTVNPVRQAWLNLAESIVAFYSDQVDVAISKGRRSHAIASIDRNARLLSTLSSAWLSHYYRNLCDVAETISWLTVALEYTEEGFAEANGRLSLVLADGWLEAGRADEAERWYRRSRAVASIMGDAALTGALIYNRAAMHVSNARVDAALGTPTSYSLAMLELEAASATHHGEYYGISVSGWLLDFLRGQLNMICRNYTEAAECLCDRDVAAHVQAWPHLEVLRRSDLLRCRLPDQSVDTSLMELEDLVSEFSNVKSPADRIVIVEQLLACAVELKSDSLSIQLKKALDSIAMELAEVRERYCDGLSRIESIQSEKITNVFRVV